MLSCKKAFPFAHEARTRIHYEEKACKNTKNKRNNQIFYTKNVFFLHICAFCCNFARFLSKKSMNNEFLQLEEEVLRMLKTVYDPEIPVNVYDLGLIYKIDIHPNEQGKDGDTCVIDMTLTAPNCPAADFLVEDIRQKVLSVQGISDVQVNIVFEPEWTQDMMSDEAKLELGFM